MYLFFVSLSLRISLVWHFLSFKSIFTKALAPRCSLAVSNKLTCLHAIVMSNGVWNVCFQTVFQMLASFKLKLHANAIGLHSKLDLKLALAEINYKRQMPL